MTGIFYVYEHWRPDRNECFYVGKGCGSRAYSKDRSKHNKHYRHISKKLDRLGLSVEVRIICSDLAEGEAFALEKERIAFWRRQNISLANCTDGGEGLSNPSPEVRAKMSAARKGKTLSEQTRANLSASCMGRSYGPHKPEHRAKISAGNLGRKDSEEVRQRKRLAAQNRGPLDKNACHKIAASVAALWQDEEYRLRMSEAHIGHRPTEEARANMRAAQQARAPRSDDTKAKQSASIKAWHARRRETKEIISTGANYDGLDHFR